MDALRTDVTLVALALGLLAGCSDDESSERVPLAPTAGQPGAEAVAESANLVDVHPSTHLGVSEGQVDRASVAAAPPEEVQLVEIEVRALSKPLDEMALRLILVDPEKVAGGFKAANKVAKPKWSWNVAETFGEELEIGSVWSEGDSGPVLLLRVPRPSITSRVVGRLGDRIATGRLPRDPEAALVLDFGAPSERVREVLVKRVDGQPAAGVEVMPVRRTTRRLPPMDPERAGLARRSDRLGRVELAARPDLAMAARVIAGDPVVGEGEAPCSITLPPVAALRVLLEMPAGLPFQGELSAPTIRLTRPASWSGSPREDLGTIEAFGGTATIYPVRAGATLTIEALAGGLHGSAKVTLPDGDGEELEIKVPMEEVPCVRFRAFDPAGTPLAGLKLGIRLNFPRGKEHATESSEDGVVTCWLNAHHGGAIREVYIREITSSRDVNDGRIAMVALGTPTKGTADLGLVTLRPVPTFVAGTVVDQDGQPVHNARVEIRSPGRSGGLIIGGSKDSEPFPGSVERTRTKTDRSGAFVIRMGDPNGSLPAGSSTAKLQLEAARGARSSLGPVPFQPGQTDVVIRIYQQGGLRADASRYSRSETEGVYLMLRRGDEPGLGELVHFGRDNLFTKLKPGTYSLHLSGGLRSDTIMEGIEVEPGKILEDPRLNPIDLSSVLHLRFVDVLAAGGALPSTIQFGAIAKGDSEEYKEIEVRDGRAVIPVWVDSDSPGYVFYAEGFQEIEVPEIVDGTALEFAEGIAVTLELGGSERPLGPTEFRVALLAPDGPGEGARSASFHLPSIEFDADGRATMRAPRAGRYALYHAREPGGPMGSAWRSVEFVVPKEGGRVTILPSED